MSASFVPRHPFRREKFRWVRRNAPRQRASCPSKEIALIFGHGSKHLLAPKAQRPNPVLEHRAVYFGERAIGYAITLCPPPPGVRLPHLEQASRAFRSSGRPALERKTYLISLYPLPSRVCLISDTRGRACLRRTAPLASLNRFIVGWTLRRGFLIRPERRRSIRKPRLPAPRDS